MITTGETMGLAEGIIDDIHVLFILSFFRLYAVFCIYSSALEISQSSPITPDSSTTNAIPSTSKDSMPSSSNIKDISTTDANNNETSIIETDEKIIKGPENVSESFDEIVVDEIIEVANVSQNENECDDDISELKDEVIETEKDLIHFREDSIQIPVEHVARSDDFFNRISSPISDGLRSRNYSSNDEVDNLEIRRAMHRAGLDHTSILSSPSRTSSRLSNYSSATAEDNHKSRTTPVADRGSRHLDSWRSRFMSGGSGSDPLERLSPNVKFRIGETKEQLMAMGFTDEDGWLTDLVTMKKGNIDEVLDALAPVQNNT